MALKQFTIYGERCSGTNFLFHAMQKNFTLSYTEKYGNKHFFGFHAFETERDGNVDTTLFIGIIRNPVEWIDSFIKKPHHLPEINKQNIHSFLFQPFYSIYDDSREEIMEDRNMLHPTERYKNIFEARAIKTDFLSKEMPKKVKNYLLIRYEDLRDNYTKLLEFIEKKFSLVRKNPQFIPIESYKGNQQKGAFIKKPVVLHPTFIKIIHKNLNKEQENSLGYGA